MVVGWVIDGGGRLAIVGGTIHLGVVGCKVWMLWVVLQCALEYNIKLLRKHKAAT